MEPKHDSNNSEEIPTFKNENNGQDQAELDQQNLPSVLASRDLDDRTPLHCAARQGHVEVPGHGSGCGSCQAKNIEYHIDIGISDTRNSLIKNHFFLPTKIISSL